MFLDVLYYDGLEDLAVKIEDGDTLGDIAIMEGEAVPEAIDMIVGRRRRMMRVMATSTYTALMTQGTLTGAQMQSIRRYSKAQGFVMVT